MPEGKEVVKWVDQAMFEAAPMRRKEEGVRVSPQVFLLNATPDPLGAVAAAFRMYGGKPTYSLSDVTDEEREWAWEESLKTHLKAAWEFIDFHFFIEGVTRAWTHQAVRQRTAVYAQESLRFAVKEGFAQEVPIPPAVMDNQNAVSFWEQTIDGIQKAYTALVNMGIPAEDARGLLPHCTTTRMNYKTNFRGLIEHAGNRLCTQAQFEWRSVFIGIVRAIREYQGRHHVHIENDGGTFGSFPEHWQYETIARPLPQTFTPVCYKAGRCVFMGTLDRGCTIRDRVQAFASMGVSPDRWDGHDFEDGTFMMPNGEALDGIHPQEWLANPNAGITYSNKDRPT